MPCGTRGRHFDAAANAISGEGGRAAAGGRAAVVGQRRAAVRRAAGRRVIYISRTKYYSSIERVSFFLAARVPSTRVEAPRRPDGHVLEEPADRRGSRES